MKPSPILRFLILAGTAYFCAMAFAHFFGIKWPLLFVYYDTPFYAYQDKIISFAVGAYIMLFLAASNHKEVVIYALISLGLTVLGLSAVNISNALASVMTDGQSTMPYWAQTIMLAGYWLVLVVFYRRDQSKA